MEAAGSNAENFMPDRYHSQEVWDWLSSLPQERLLELLAVHVASSVDASANHAGTLRAAQALDVRKWFTPDAENYFGKVSKDQILADLAEMCDRRRDQSLRVHEEGRTGQGRRESGFRTHGGLAADTHASRGARRDSGRRLLSRGNRGLRRSGIGNARGRSPAAHSSAVN